MAWILKISGELDEDDIRDLRESMKKYSVDAASLKLTPPGPRGPGEARSAVYTNVTVTFKWSYAAEEFKGAVSKRLKLACELKEIRG